MERRIHDSRAGSSRFSRDHPRPIFYSLMSLAACIFVAYMLGTLIERRAAQRIWKNLQNARREAAKASEASEELEATLFESLLGEARAARFLRYTHWRWFAMDRVKRAVNLKRPPQRLAELRSELLYPLLEAGAFPYLTLSNDGWMIRDCAFSHDGDRIATVDGGGGVHLWEAVSATLLWTGPDVGATATCVAFHPHERRLAVGYDDGCVRFWRAHADNPERIKRLFDSTVLSLAFAPDGDVLAAGDGSDTVALLSLGADENAHRTITSAGESVRVFSWSPDGRTLILGGAAGNVYQLNADSGDQMEVIVGQRAPIVYVGHRPDGRRLVTVAEDGFVHVWETNSGTMTRVWQLPGGGILDAVLRPVGNDLIISSRVGGLNFLDLVTGAARRQSERPGHSVVSLAVSPDGSLLLGADVGGGAAIYTVAGGDDAIVLDPHYNFRGSRSLAFSADSALLVSGGGDGVVAINAVPQDVLPTDLVSGIVLSADFSPDGRSIAVACKDPKVVVLWNLASRSAERVLRGHDGAVLAVAWSPKGDVIATSTDLGTVRLWDAQTGALLRAVDAHAAPVNAVAFSHDGKYLASGSFDNTVKVWRMTDRDIGSKPLVIDSHRGYVLGLAWSSRRHTLASSSADHLVRVWNIAESAASNVGTNEGGRLTAALVASLVGHTSHVFSVDFSGDGSLLASAGNDRTIRVWDYKKRRAVVTTSAHSAKVLAVAFAPDGGHVASSAVDGSVRLWRLLRVGDVTSTSAGPTDASSIELVADLSPTSVGVPALKFSSGGEFLAAGSWDRAVRLWRVAELASSHGRAADEIGPETNSHRTELPPSLEPHLTLGGRTFPTSVDRWAAAQSRIATPTILAMTSSPDGKSLAFGCKEPNVVVQWDPKSNGAPRLMRGHTGEVLAIASSPDGKWLVTGSVDRTIRVWNAGTGEQQIVLRTHAATVNAVAFAPTGGRFATGGFDGRILLWELNAGESPTVRQVAEARIDGGKVLGLAFAPNEGLLASASSDGLVRLWETAKPGDALVERCSLAGHDGFVYGVDFDSKGRYLVSAGHDQRIRVWDVEKQRSIRTLPGHAQRVFVAKFSPDDRLIASGSEDSTVKLWDRNTGKVLHELQGHQAGVAAIEFSRDGARLWSGSWERTIREWDVKTGKTLRVVGGHDEPVFALDVSTDEQYVASATSNGRVRMTHWNRGDITSAIESAWLAPVSTPLSDIGVVRGGGRMLRVATENRSELVLWDLRSNQRWGTIIAKSAVTSFAVDQNGERLAAGFEDGSIASFRLPEPGGDEIDIESLDGVVRWQAHSSPVRLLEFAASGEALASYSDFTVKLWQSSAGAERASCFLGNAPATVLAFVVDGGILAVAVASGDVQLWSATGELLVTLPGRGRPLNAVRFSPDGRMLATAGDGLPITIWPLETLRERFAQLHIDW